MIVMMGAQEVSSEARYLGSHSGHSAASSAPYQHPRAPTGTSKVLKSHISTSAHKWDCHSIPRAPLQSFPSQEAPLTPKPTPYSLLETQSQAYWNEGGSGPTQ